MSHVCLNLPFPSRRAVESITLDREELHLKDNLMPRYAELVYNGFWFSPEREALQALVDKTQEYCTGEGGGVEPREVWMLADRKSAGQQGG